MANERMENIGARRLHTVMTTLLEEVLFELPDWPEKRIVFDADGGARAAGQDRDTDGNLLFSGCGRATGTRFE